MPLKRRQFIKLAAMSSSGMLEPLSKEISWISKSVQSAKVPINVGSRKQLFIDTRFIASQKGITLRLNQPNLYRKNLLLADRPWDAARANHYSSMIYDQRFRLWYSAHASVTDFPRWGPGATAFDAGRTCYAESDDGVHFSKPNLGLVKVNGSTANNVVIPGVSHCVFQDPFDSPDKRYKMLIRIGGFNPAVTAEWPEAKGASIAFLYVAYSKDGLEWRRYPRPFFTLSVSSQRSVIWDDRISKWVVYVRGHRATKTFYSRIEVEKGMWNQTVAFHRMPGRKYRNVPIDYNDKNATQDAFGAVRLEEELPIALDVDQHDPPHASIYSMNAWKYPAAEDVYLAFVPVWYNAGGSQMAGRPYDITDWRRNQGVASDRVEVQLAISRDGIRYERPWKLPLISPDVMGSEAAGQIWPVPDPVIRDNEIWLYYQAVPYAHLDFLAPKYGQGITARAVFRLDRFVSAETDRAGGEIITPPLRFTGNQLQLNVNAAAGGRLRVAIESVKGEKIPGYAIDDADSIMGNNIAAIASWRGKSDLSHLQAQVIRLRVVMDYCQLYAFQFR